jgi:hypothetical protein
MKNFVAIQMQNYLATVFLLLCLTGVSNSAAAQSWRSLTPTQREALAPMVQRWDTLPDVQRQRLLETAKRYPHMTSEQKQRYHGRLEKWSKLTPEQRKAAREKYRAFNKVPIEKREQVKQMVKEEQARKARQSASDVSAAPVNNQH